MEEVGGTVPAGGGVVGGLVWEGVGGALDRGEEDVDLDRVDPGVGVAV